MPGRRSILLFVALIFPVFVGRADDRRSEQSAAGKQPLKIFILAGQSNMQGHAHVRTIPAMKLNPAAAPLLKDLLNPDGTPKVCERVWISSIGSADSERTGRVTVGFGAEARGPKIGPEFSFGVYAEKMLDGPVLIIKTAWGGKSLNTDFRPPGAGPYEFNATQLEALERQGKDIEKVREEKAKATGRYYRLMMEHIQYVLNDIRRVYPDYDASQGYELAGFVWFQGWNDMVDRGTYPRRDQPGGYDLYTKLLAQFIRDVRSDLKTPDLPFVIGVIGVGGPTRLYGPDQRRYQAVHQNFRDAMAAPAGMPEFRGNVEAVLTENFWDQQVVQLRRRERTLKPKLDELRLAVREKRMTREMAAAKTEELYQKTFSADERTILRDSVSNAEFHYLGSAGIMSQIGKAFAESAVRLWQKKNADARPTSVR